MSNRRLEPALSAVEKLIGHDPARRQRIEELEAQFDVAQLVYDLRTSRGLTQTELAKLVGTSQPMIAKLENANYRGQSLRMLRRIADALDLKLVLQFHPKTDVRSTNAGRKRAPAAAKASKSRQSGGR